MKMKKIVSMLSGFALLASVASADVWRVEGAIGAWQSQTGDANAMSYRDYSGTGRYITNGEDKTDLYAWLLFKHPIPIVPNIRLEYASIEDKGIVEGNFEDFVTVGVNTPGTISMKQYDIIPYYNLLDNLMWTTLDLGIDVKVLDTTVKAQGVNIKNIATIGNYEESKILPVPMGYARVRVEVPSTGLGIEGDVKYITYSGSTVSDIRVKADYTFDLAGVSPGVEVGYRMQNFDLKSDDEKTRIDLKYSGFYAGLMVRF